MMKLVFAFCMTGAVAQDWWTRRRRSSPSPSPSKPYCPSKNLQECLQAELDSVRSYYAQTYSDLAMQVGFHHSSEVIGIASGTVSGRNVTIDDTFTYGSGTKPVTATAVMRLIDSGKIKGDDNASSIIDPYLQRINGTTMAGLFGESVNSATVLDVIRMSAGIPDFEFGNFDYDVLKSGQFIDYPLAAMHYVASQKSLQCAPGSCSGYSSTSYEVAGLLLAALLSPDSPWYSMDLGAAALPDRSRYPSLVFPPQGKKTGKLSDVMTVPGIVTSSRFGRGQTYYDQNPSTLGFTCGNMVGSARDVAAFFYDLLNKDSKHPIVSDSSRTEMTTFKTTDKGWFAGHLRYGAGLIQRSTSGSEYITSGGAGDWGYDIGHVGETYGFSSSQGYLGSLGFAYSVSSNVDSGSAASYMTCQLHQIAIEVLGNATVNLGCSENLAMV